MRHELRYRGQSFELPVEEERALSGASPGLGASALREAFDDVHEAAYGYREPTAELELVNLRVSVWGAAPALKTSGAPDGGEDLGSTMVVFDGRPVPTRLIRGEPPADSRFEGPAICALEEATLLVPPGWSCVVDPHGTIRMSTPELDVGDA